MKTVVMIPIKMNSERVPGKNTKHFFDGTPLMSLIQRACLEAETIDEVYVYCSNASVEEYLEPGVELKLRPAYLDGDGCNCNDIIREFIKEVEADAYVVCHATGPFTKPDSIDACVRAVTEDGYDSAFLAKRMQSFLWQNGHALNFDPQCFPRTQDLVPIYEEASGAFAFPRETFLRFDRRVGECPYIHEVDFIEALDIDYPDDFLMANMIYKEMMCNARAD